MSANVAAINAARDFIRGQAGLRPEIALILGSGLGGVAAAVRDPAAIPYADIPGFPLSTVPGHAGRLLLGRLEGRPVAVMQGRFHYYEGYPMPLVVFPLRVLHSLGATTLIVTNAAGGLNPDFEPGDVMLIRDHINHMGANPLLGPNEDALGPRFLDMTHAYDAELRALAVRVAAAAAIPLRQGVYIALSGPTFETPAERRLLRQLGADAVGMSTVPEVIAARHAGMRVLGFSAISNVATGGPDQPADSHEEVLAMAEVAGRKLQTILLGVLAEMG
ncbi:MAG: purine-nucleoside phosphorylase [Candidatus Promineifilaceae bacterium]